MRPSLHSSGPCRLLLALVCLAFGGLSLSSTAQAEPPKHGVPETRPIQLDGHPLKAEWSSAKMLPFPRDGSVLRIQQFRGTLMLALQSDRTWTRGSGLSLFFCPDGPKAGATAPGCVRIDLEPFEHDRDHLFVYRNVEDGPSRLRDVVVVRHSLRGGATGIEMAIPLSLLGLTSKARPALRFCAQWNVGGRSLTWPANLAFRAPTGTMPRDYASAANWGLLEGWGDPAGPGAFPRKDWDAWIARDRTVREAGATAHHTVNLLLEEWKKTKKRDKELVPQVLGSFETVAEHEPLTALDQLRIATCLRYLNRHERALGLLDGLLHHPDRAVGLQAYRERALLLHAMQRFEDAALTWERLAARTARPYNTAYTKAAAAERRIAQGWAKERAARRVDEADPSLPRVELHTTHGVIEIVLHAKDLPKQAAHFLAMVKRKVVYDGTLFHRVHGDFLAQGGDPVSRDQGLAFAGRGGPGIEIDMEINPRHAFWRGAIGFARGMRKANGSQFFMMTAPNPDLGEYTCFGHIVHGQHVADRLEYGDTLTKVVIRRDAAPPAKERDAQAAPARDAGKDAPPKDTAKGEGKARPPPK